MALHKWLSSGSITLNYGDYRKSGIFEGEVPEHPEGDMVPKSQSIGTPQKKAKKKGKYNEALKLFLPIRPPSKNKGYLPSNAAGYFSFVSTHWLTSLMWKAFRSGLTKDDLWELWPVDRVEPNAERFEKLWNEEVKQKGADKASLTYTVWRFTRTRQIVTMILILISMIFQFIGPAWLLKALLQFVEDTSQPIGFGLALVGVLCGAQMGRALTWATVWAIGCHTSTRVQGALQYFMYQKMLRLKTGGEKVLSQMITFCTNDQERIYEAVAGGVLFLATPVMFTMSLVYTIMLLGPWAIIGNVVILCFYPVMGGLAKFTSMLRVRTVQLTDQRVGLMNEILNSIRLIKMYGWEESFAKKVKCIRNDEERELQRAAFLQSISATVTPSINILASVLTFLAYSLAGNNLTAADAFTIFSVFSAMQFTIGTLPYSIKSIAEAVVCFRRMQKFLNLPEFTYPDEISKSDDPGNVIVIKRGTFAWEATKAPVQRRRTSKSKSKACVKQKKEENENKTFANGALKGESQKLLSNSPQLFETLYDINLKVQRGKLIGICGSVGSGKSSLISAIIGDMTKTTGELRISGKFAYVTQQAWIFNETVQENILFGLPMDEDRYQTVIDVCSLKTDLELFPRGDMTEIGEKGTNLSGGQKQRINLARAVYSNRDILLLDDPLSAVDTKVANSIFHKCIKGYLKDKTVLLVTHGIQFLKQCDEVVFLKDGQIAECKSCTEFTNLPEGYLQLEEYVEEEKTEAEKEEKEDEDDDKDDETNLQNGGDSERGKLVQDEDQNTKYSGSIAYKKYAQYCGGCCVVSLVILVMIFFALSRLFSTIWLQIWLDKGDEKEGERYLNISLYNMNYTSHELKGYVSDNPNLWFYQLIYGLSVVVMLLLGLVKGYTIARQLVVGSSVLHHTMFNNVMRSPTSFFDVTPTGRILNRFSKDMDELDVRMPFFVEFVGQSLLFVLSQLIMICVLFPYFTIAMFIIMGLFVFLDMWLNVGVRECKKLDNVLRSPNINHLTSTMAGLSVIRIFQRQQVFQYRFAKSLNRHLSAEIVFHFASRWFTFRMDIAGFMIVVITAIIAVCTRDSTTAAETGLALSAVFSVCLFIPFVMRMKSEMQARFTSVERILEFAEDLTSEAAHYIPEKKPASTWPETGAIIMEDMKVRYRQGLPLVLHGLSANIRGGEKIGIVGRTGAGKTSLISTLLRLSELDSGKIYVDGIDISTIGLHDLRSAIAVIPQDPVLFQGTVRYNLDPFDEHPDEKIWSALEKSYMKQKVAKEEHQLLTAVEADGENFSVGEKQLICLARALIRGNKILLLDEATASVDVTTDALVQNTIREAFAKCTVLTIAHRLNTVATYDRIMVLDAGKMIEFDTPANLMAEDNSVFRQMMLAMGVTSLEGLK